MGMTRIVARIVVLMLVGTGISGLSFSAKLHAQNAPNQPVIQNPMINELRGKIFDAKMTQQTFAGGLAHCSELNGTNFYFQPRDRVLSLSDYHRSLDNLVLQAVFNPETKRPWNQQDANARWEQVQKQATTDQANCALVASLPEMQKRLQELQQAAAASQGNPPPNSK
jgi:hypothetical protein